MPFSETVKRGNKVAICMKVVSKETKVARNARGSRIETSIQPLQHNRGNRSGTYGPVIHRKHLPSLTLMSLIFVNSSATAK